MHAICGEDPKIWVIGSDVPIKMWRCLGYIRELMQAIVYWSMIHQFQILFMMVYFNCETKMLYFSLFYFYKWSLGLRHQNCNLGFLLSVLFFIKRTCITSEIPYTYQTTYRDWMDPEGRCFTRLFVQRSLTKTKITFKTSEPLQTKSRHCLPPPAFFRKRCHQTQVVWNSNTSKLS